MDRNSLTAATRCAADRRTAAEPTAASVAPSFTCCSAHSTDPFLISDVSSSVTRNISDSFHPTATPGSGPRILGYVGFRRVHRELSLRGSACRCDQGSCWPNSPHAGGRRFEGNALLAIPRSRVKGDCLEPKALRRPEPLERPARCVAFPRRRWFVSLARSSASSRYGNDSTVPTSSGLRRPAGQSHRHRGGRFAETRHNVVDAGRVTWLGTSGRLNGFLRGHPASTRRAGSSRPVPTSLGTHLH